MLRSNLTKITKDLIREDVSFVQQKDLADGLFDLFADAATLEIEKDENRASIYTEGGRAISVFEAALCTKQYVRTRQFLIGIHQCILEAQRKFQGETIRIFYAGTGPFATLMLPITTLFSPEEVQFTLLEINEQALTCLEMVIERFDAKRYVEEIIHGDACTYQLAEKGKHHIFITETMQEALKNEPQVAITLNLLTQMKSDCYLIPERIVVDLWVIDLKRDLERMQGDLEAVSDYYLELGNVLDFNKETVTEMLEKRQGDPFKNTFECNSVKCLPNLDKRFHGVYLMTKISVFGDSWLKPYESSLNLPVKIARNLDLVIGDCQLDFYYEVDKKPKFKWKKRSSSPVEMVKERDEDEEQIKTIFEESRFELKLIPDKALQMQIISQQYEIEKHQMIRVHPQHEKYVMTVDGQVVGRIYFTKLADHYRVLELGVLESFRGLGIGKLALEWLQEKARSKALELRLQVAKYNTNAISLYQSLGFKVFEEDEVFYQLKWQ